MWKYYHDRRHQLQSGCVRELETEGHPGAACESLDGLERMVYEVAFSGDAEQLYHMLKVSKPTVQLPPCRVACHPTLAAGLSTKLATAWPGKAMIPRNNCRDSGSRNLL